MPNQNYAKLRSAAAKAKAEAKKMRLIDEALAETDPKVREKKLAAIEKEADHV